MALATALMNLLLMQSTDHPNHCHIVNYKRRRIVARRRTMMAIIMMMTKAESTFFLLGCTLDECSDDGYDHNKESVENE